MTLPRISIITPSFNQASFLEQTIDSVLSQAYPNLEYIIIDGGSTDNSVEIIKRYEKHLAYWTSEKDHGQSHAINKGLAMATGEIVNWLNSDDYYEPGALHIIENAFSDNSVNCVCARGNVVIEDRVIKKSNGTDVFQFDLAKTIGYARIDQPETFFRKSVFEAVGLLNEKLHYLMDREFWIRYLLKFGIDHVHKVDEVIVNFRLHPNSKTTNHQKLFAKEHAELFGRLGELYEAGSTSEFILQEFGPPRTTMMLRREQGREGVVAEALIYYLLQEADKAYYEFDWDKSRRVLQFVSKCNISDVQTQIYHRLSLRLRVPKPLIKLLRGVLKKVNGFSNW